MKSDIEVRRSRNEHGTLTWQLGEIWPTGGWGSLEYGTVGWLDGQVLGGRWKPLHHMLEQHLYRDVVAVCGADALCFVKNSNPLQPVFGKLHAVLFDIHTQKEIEISSSVIAVGAGPAAHRFCLGDPSAQHDCPPYTAILAKHQRTSVSSLVILRLGVTSSQDVTVSEENVVFIVPPANMTIPASTVAHNVSQPHPCSLLPGDVCSTVICLPPLRHDLLCTRSHALQVLLYVSSAPAMFVSLVTKEQGRFLRNNMLLTTGEHVVEFLHLGEPQGALLQETIRVEHLYQYVV